ncbi:MAG: aldose 1-epimerase [Chloroflexi bacterium]|nr:aldose 1-epimerase [Chloroflexota bacterium]
MVIPMACPTVPGSADDQTLPAEVFLEQPGAVAAFTPSEGFWCTAFRVRYRDSWVRILAEPPSWSALCTRPTWYGNPLLFPYPLSIAQGSFIYRGRSYSVRPGREGRPIHGLVRDNAWVIDAFWSDEHGAHARASISTGEGANPGLCQYFPFPFRFTTSYTLWGTSLSMAFEATNLGDQPMPLGLGIHPYFPVPLIPGGAASDAIVRSDVAYRLPHLLSEAQTEWQAPSGPYDLCAGQRVSDLLQLAGAGSKSLLLAYVQRADLDAPTSDRGTGLHWSLADAEHGLSIDIISSDAFRALVLYAPPAQNVISPVISTCLSDGFNRSARGAPSGTIELDAGDTWRAWIRMDVSVENGKAS